MSDRLTFAHTFLRTKDGREFKVGDVLRPHNADTFAFCDHVVLGFSGVDKYGDVYVKLGRPFAYASCVGTTSPSVLTGVEEYTVSATKLATDFKVGDKMVAGGVREPFPSEIIDIAKSEGKLPPPGVKVDLLKVRTECQDVNGRTLNAGDLAYWYDPNNGKGPGELYAAESLPDAMRNFENEARHK